MVRRHLPAAGGCAHVAARQRVGIQVAVAEVVGAGVKGGAAGRVARGGERQAAGNLAACTEKEGGRGDGVSVTRVQ